MRHSKVDQLDYLPDSSKINSALNTVLRFDSTTMAYGGKSDCPSLGNVPTTSDVNLKYISGRNADDSKSADSKYAVVDFDVFKSPRLIENRYSKRLNSGTPCISTAFTPIGKPSAISTSKNTTNRKHLTSGISVNDSSKPPVFNRPNKVFNTGTPCTSRALTPLGKSSAISTANLTEITPRNAIKDSMSPPVKYSKSNTADQSIMRHYAALETTSTICSVGGKEFIPGRTVNDSTSPTFKCSKSNTTRQNIMKYYTALENSSTIRTAESKDFIPRKAVNDSSSPPFKDTKSDIAHQDMMKYNTPLRKSSTVNSKDFIFGNGSNDSSETVHQTTFNKHYNTPLRKSYPFENPSGKITDFNFGSRKSQGNNVHFLKIIFFTYF